MRWVILTGLVLIIAEPASATTLQRALVATYGSNPSLDEQRANLRATDEDAAIARGQGRPTANVNASYQYGISGLRPYAGYNRALLAGAQIEVPLYQGGRVRNAIKAADIRSSAGRSELAATEGDIFVDAVTAYLDVLRDEAIVRFDTENISAIGQVRAASEARLKQGDVTRTDVAQTMSRTQSAESELAAADAALVASQQSFRRITGLAAENLQPVPPLPPLPLSANAAVDLAMANNPALRAATQLVDAAGRDVSAARGAVLPTISASGGNNFYSYRDRFGGIGNVDDNASSVGVTLTLPLYQGGVASAQVRKARDRADAAEDRRRAIARQVDAGVRSAFASYQSALRSLTASRAAVEASGEALRGVRIEADAGERQVLDLLNAELEQLNAQIALARAQHDVYAAGFQLLNAMGLVSYQKLGLEGGVLYDPMTNYRHAQHVLSDFADSPSAAEKGYRAPQP